MSDAEKKALELMAEAEKKLGGGKSFLGGLFGYLFNYLFSFHGNHK